MLEGYKTLRGAGEAEITEKKSRFIATARPVSTEEEARGFIEETNKKYWDAAHNVYAYQTEGVRRFSDDGEPQGSAGMPVLNALSSGEIINACVVVTRYFGGTLLGVGGLVRAYGKAAAAGIASAGIADMALVSEFSVRADYSLLGKLQYFAASGGCFVTDTVYTDAAELTVLVRRNEEAGFVKGIADASAGRAEVVKKCEKYVDLAGL